MNLKLTTVIREVPEGGYVAFIEEIPGVNTQGETIEEAKENLFDALELSFDYHRQKTDKEIGRKTKGVFKQEFSFVML